MPTIEELIKQKGFRSEQHKTIISLNYAANLMNRYHDEVLGRFGITGQQYNVLRILRGQYPAPVTVSLIRERMIDKMSDASRIVERLRKIGLIERVTNKKDRRAVDVTITQKGIDILAELDKCEKELYKPMDKLNDEDARQLNALLQRIYDSLLG
jgi:MarR family multiple gene transcriptional regulator MgrA